MSAPRTVVVGLGNPLRGDDGVGLEVVERLQELGLPPRAAAVNAGSPGIGLPCYLEGYDRAILVDCARMGLAPGAFRVFRPEEVTSRRPAVTTSAHDGDPLEGLRLARALGRPVECLLVGIEPQTLEGAVRLSPAVAAAVPRVVAQVQWLCVEESEWIHGGKETADSHR